MASAVTTGSWGGGEAWTCWIPSEKAGLSRWGTLARFPGRHFTCLTCTQATKFLMAAPKGLKLAIPSVSKKLKETMTKEVKIEMICIK